MPEFNIKTKYECFCKAFIGLLHFKTFSLKCLLYCTRFFQACWTLRLWWEASAVDCFWKHHVERNPRCNPMCMAMIICITWFALVFSERSFLTFIVYFPKTILFFSALTLLVGLRSMQNRPPKWPVGNGSILTHSRMIVSDSPSFRDVCPYRIILPSGIMCQLISNNSFWYCCTRTCLTQFWNMWTAPDPWIHTPISAWLVSLPIVPVIRNDHCVCLMTAHKSRRKKLKKP